MTLRGLIDTPPIMRRHPLTGKPIEPVGVVGNKVIYPIMGGAPDGDDDGNNDDGSQDGGSGDTGSGDTGDNGGSGDSGTTDPAELLRRLEETERRMKAADKRADAAEKKIKEQEDAKKDELTKATDELTEAQQKIDTLTKENTSLKLKNAFLTANKHSWHDPDTALALADNGGYLDGVIDEEDGTVDKKALGSALDRLAKDKAFLVKSKDKQDDSQDSPSGEPAGGRSNNSKDEKVRKQQLKSRFSSLNR
jgi:hypothetical protein